jgi:glucose 1-dehydrogenase
MSKRVAIVTGAGVGIGYEIARQLSERGVGVILNDIDAEAATSAVEQIRAAGGACEAVVGDSSDLAVIEQMVARAVATYGRLDYAVANAGITTFGDFLEYPLEQFQQLMAVNLQGTFFLAQRAARQIIAQEEGGRLVLMSSVTGHQYHPNLIAYGMTKAAVRMLAKGLGADLAPHRITVNAISPGATLTARTTSDEDYAAEWSRLTPTGRPATVGDIAAAALFFLSDEAAQVTGQTLVVDGGWTATSPPPSE